VRGPPVLAKETAAQSGAKLGGSPVFASVPEIFSGHRLTFEKPFVNRSGTSFPVRHCSSLTKDRTAQFRGMDRALDPRPVRRKRAIVLGCAGGILLGAILFWTSAFTSRRVRVDGAKLSIGTVERGSFNEFVPVTANVLPIRSVLIDALEGGTIEAVYAEDGKEVKQGDPILKLDNPQVHMDAINREAQLLDQQNNLRNTRLTMDQQTTTLRDALLKLDYDLHQTERTWTTNEALMDKGLVARQEYERSKEEYELMQGKRRLLMQNIRTDSIFRQTQVGQINSSLELIHTNLQFLQDNLENLTVRAPIDGQLSGLRADIGSTKQRGDHLAQIDVMTGLKLRAKVPEHYVGRVTQGLKATFDFAGRNYSVTVNKVYPEVTNGEFEVDLVFDGETPDAIKRGQSLQVRLQLGEASEAVLVPRGPFFQDTGGQWVYVLKDGTAVKRNVTLGRQNPENYEVLQGLDPGEQVITSRYDLFNNADEIIVQ